MPESCKHGKMDFFGERSHPSKVKLAFEPISVLTVLTWGKQQAGVFTERLKKHSRNLLHTSLLHVRPLARRQESHQLALATSSVSSFLPGRWNSTLKLREMSTKMDMLQLLHMSKSVDDACCLPPMMDCSPTKGHASYPRSSKIWAMTLSRADHDLMRPWFLVRRLVTFLEECTSKSESKSYLVI